MSNLDTVTAAIEQALKDLNKPHLAEIRRVFTATCAQHGGQQVFRTDQKMPLADPDHPNRSFNVTVLAAKFEGDEPGFVAALVNPQTHEFVVVHSADLAHWPTPLDFLIRHVTGGIRAALAKHTGNGKLN